MSSESGASLGLRSDITTGPAMRWLRRRALIVWAAVAAVGIGPALAGASAPWRAIGLGLWFPGAGFLVDGAWHLTLLTLVLFGVSIAGWILVGGFVFPAGVWVGSAVLAAVVADQAGWGPATWVVPALVAAAVLMFGGATLANRSRRRAEAEEIRTFLAAHPVAKPPDSVPEPGELSEVELRSARFIFDLALQPIESFDGFTTIDQFREAAWRYQLVAINYALAAMQVNHTPAFRGYLHEAQRNAVIKMLDRRVWHYWRVENLLGNGVWGRDPIISENVMYSGWWALALGAYERATGDLSFSEPGALTLVESAKRCYPYDYPAITRRIAEQFDETGLCFFPCEPNWVFSVCNLYGMTGMLLFDREHGTAWGRDRLDRFTDVLEREFMTSDGRSTLISSRRAGIRISSSGALYPSTTAWLAGMVSPRVAQSSWALARRALEKQTQGNLADLAVTRPGAVDPGNYQPNGTYYWASLMLSARELGDDELYGIASAGLDANGFTDDRVTRRYRGSTFTNLTSHVARFGTEGTWHRFAWGDVNPATRTGPYLDNAPYPDVLVGSATNDGTMLEAVLYPGRQGGRTEVRFGGLAPGQRYRVSMRGDTQVIEADHGGSAQCAVMLHGRSPLAVIPEP